MSLHDRLTEDLKSAMKSRDQLRMDVIRMIKAAVQYKEVELKQDLDDAGMSRIMTTLIKQRKEAAEQLLHELLLRRYRHSRRGRPHARGDRTYALSRRQS